VERLNGCNENMKYPGWFTEDIAVIFSKLTHINVSSHLYVEAQTEALVFPDKNTNFTGG
jgi:hypothetical protein